jgi:DNA-binding GntR family transcriptional regulator
LLEAHVDSSVALPCRPAAGWMEHPPVDTPARMRTSVWAGRDGFGPRGILPGLDETGSNRISFGTMSSVYIGQDGAHPFPAGGLKNHPSLQERAHQVLREAILEGRYKPGERIYEVAIAEALGISRNPVREGIRRLQQEGLVEVRPRSGVFVATLSLGEAGDLYQIRAALEGVAAAFAAERMTADEKSHLRSILGRMRTDGDGEDISQVVDEFHAAIRTAAHSKPLAAVLGQVFVQVSRFRELAFAVDPPTAYEDHSRLLDLIVDGDAATAEQLMRAHVLEVYARVKTTAAPEGTPKKGRSARTPRAAARGAD